MKRACSSTYAHHYIIQTLPTRQYKTHQCARTKQPVHYAQLLAHKPISLHRPYQTLSCPPYTLAGQRRQVALLTHLLASLVSYDQSLANLNRIYHEKIYIWVWNANTNYKTNPNIALNCRSYLLFDQLVKPSYTHLHRIHSLVNHAPVTLTATLKIFNPFLQCYLCTKKKQNANKPLPHQSYESTHSFIACMSASTASTRLTTASLVYQTQSRSIGSSSASTRSG